MDTDIERYATLIVESTKAEALAEQGNIDRAMISAEKSQMLYNSLVRDGGLERMAETGIEHKVTPDFKQRIAAEAYLAVAETALTCGNVKNAQIHHLLIMPGTDLRQHLDSEDLSKRAKRLDNLLCIVNRKYFN